MPEDLSIHVFADGRTYAGHRDPPGQSSIYIPPGDVWNENYRLSTFIQYPDDTPVIPAHLASAGFYYTGYKDRVKCFSCGLCVENWMYGDDVGELRWHRSDCDFANGRATANERILSAFSKFRFGATTLASSPRHNLPLQSSLSPPPSSGGTNNASSPSTSSPPHDVTPTISATNHQISSPAAYDIPPPQTINQGTLPNPTHNANPVRMNNERERQELFPCRAPVNPHMTSAVSRLESFKPHNGTRWPRERLRASIDELVNAGFFYLGERDRVKCWYCNGGLQNWDYDDEPWSEHAKWFPTCEFLLRVKGPTYVENIVGEFPNLNRPVPMDIPPSPREPPRPAPAVRTPSPPSVSTQPSATAAVDHAFETLEYVKQAREMGVDEETIKSVLKRKYETNGQFYTSGEEFHDVIFSYQSQPASNSQASISSSHPTPSISSRSPSGSASMSSTATQELEQLEESRRCKICKRDPSNVVLTPCGHLASCENCCAGLRKCPVCSRSVRDVIKTFRA